MLKIRKSVRNSNNFAVIKQHNLFTLPEHDKLTQQQEILNRDHEKLIEDRLNIRDKQIRPPTFTRHTLHDITVTSCSYIKYYYYCHLLFYTVVQDVNKSISSIETNPPPHHSTLPHHSSHQQYKSSTSLYTLFKLLNYFITSNLSHHIYNT